MINNLRWFYRMLGFLYSKSEWPFKSLFIKFLIFLLYIFFITPISIFYFRKKEKRDSLYNVNKIYDKDSFT